MKKTTGVTLGVGVVLAVAAIAWALAPRPIEVEVAQVTTGRFEATIDEDGKTRLRDRYVVSAPLAGQLARIALREGDAVSADAVVATLMPALPAMTDARTLREQQLRVEVAEAQVGRVDARVESAQVALAQATNELRRSEQLARDGFVSPTKLDTDRLATRAAQKGLDAAREERHVAGHELEQAAAALMAVRVGTGSRERAFAVHAPIAGKVLRVVQPSETNVGLGAPLMEIGDTRALEVVAELLTTDALRAVPGTRVRIERWGGDGLLEGRVRLVEPSAFTKISALGVEEQRVKVLIDITSPAAQWTALGDGFRVGVRILTTEVASAVKVPVSAVFPTPRRGDDPAGGMAVFVLDQGRARLVDVRVGERNGTEASIRDGIATGSRVIVYPPPGVKDGSRVTARAV